MSDDSSMGTRGKCECEEQSHRFLAVMVYLAHATVDHALVPTT